MINFIKNFIKLHFSLGISRMGANLAYYLLFSIFPMLIFLNSVLALININFMELEHFLEFLPDEIIFVMKEYLSYLKTSENIVPFVLGLGLLLYTFSRFVNSLVYIINAIYGIKKPKRSMISSVFFTFAMMLSVYAILILVVLGDALLKIIKPFIEIPLEFNFFILIIRYLFPVMYFFAIILLLYKFIPRKKMTFKNALPGTIYTIFATFILSYGFGIYVKYFSNYSYIYGSLSAFMLLMLWLYLSSTVIIQGSLINKMLEKNN